MAELDALYQVLQARKLASSDSSYVASLYHKGLNKILQKIGEEASEVMIAAKDAEKDGDNQALIYGSRSVTLRRRPCWTNFHGAAAFPALQKKPRAADNFERRSKPWDCSTGNTWRFC